MSYAAITFFFGLGLLALFGWYFATDKPSHRRWLGLVLTVLVTAFCLEQAIPPKEKIRLGLDLKGGVSFLLRLSETDDQRLSEDTLNQAVEVIRKRVDKFGVGEPVITKQGSDRILVQIPGLTVAEVEDTKKVLERVAKLEFATVAPGGEARIARIEAGEEVRDPSYVIKTYTTQMDGKDVTMKLLVKKRPELSGDHIKRAFSFYDNQGYGVSLTLDSEGAKIFGDLTAALAPTQGSLAILLDGVVQSAPRVNQAIYGGSAQITGNFTDKEARDLASVLENPLRVPVSIEASNSVSASLGADSIKSGIMSGVFGLILVTIFMVIYYRVVGFIAIIALLINCVMVIGALGIFGSVLTLPGIAGLILSLGIAVDANVLIYERLREELDAGKSLKAAVDSSYKKAFSAIWDAHVTQFLTAAILFWLATGPVKGFALTLTIGIVASMFSSLLVTYTCFEWAFHWKLLKKVTMLHLIKAKKFNFLGNARPFIIASIVLVVLSIVFFSIRGKGNFDADFKGGDLLVFSSQQALSTDEVRDALANTEMANSVIQAEQVAGRELISIRTETGKAIEIKKILSEKLPSSGLTFEQIDSVGPLVGEELAYKSALALALGLVGIFIYVSLRFETSFAVGSIIALLHDLIITIGLFALSGRELSLIMVAAVLTIAGYSINDKIVVFDRIRSGFRDRGNRSIAQVMNDSINETLSRTILTGGTVLLTVLALFFFGGPVLNDFAFSLIVGVLIGTYSSIFIASPIVLWWSNLTGRGIRTEVLDALDAEVQAKTSV
jgi:SecD/SecF fusion protein